MEFTSSRERRLLSSGLQLWMTWIASLRVRVVASERTASNSLTAASRSGEQSRLSTGSSASRSPSTYPMVSAALLFHLILTIAIRGGLPLRVRRRHSTFDPAANLAHEPHQLGD